MEREKKRINISSNAFVTEKTYRITKDYDIIGKIGHGAFSQTFKARHKITKQVRCIKKLKKKDFKKEEQEKLIEEVLILKDLDHPNIGKIMANWNQNLTNLTFSENSRVLSR